MTEQTAIDLPAAPAQPRPVVIPPNAPRCWVLADPPDGDEDGYPMEPHYPTDAAFREAYAEFAPEAKARQLPYVCAAPSCARCRDAFTDSEYHTTSHFPSWEEAERVARLDGWRIGPRGEFVCPACREGR